MKPSKMFSLVVILLAFLAGCASSTATPSSQPLTESGSRSEQAQSDQAQVVLAVRTPRHLKVALLTARQMLAGEGDFQAAKVDVVACGDAVPALLGDAELAGAVRETQARGARIVACGLTIRQKQLDASELLEGVEVVENGLTEIVRLQAQGYYSVEL